MIPVITRPMFKKILIVRIGNIGDVLFATPVIRKLRKSFIDSQIDILISPQGKIVVENSPYLDNIFIYKKFHRWQRWFKRKILLQKLISRQYDLCIVLESNLEYADFVYKISKTALRIGIKSDFSDEFLNRAVEFSRSRHAIENYLHVVSGLLNINISEEDYAMDFFLPKISPTLEEELNKHREHNFFIVHSSCSSCLPYRGWEMDKLIEVIKYLVNQGLDVFITGAASDKEPVALLEKLSKEKKVYSFIGRNLDEVAYLMKYSKGVLCFDTGILHLTRALAKPLVALFGPSDPRHTGPIGKGIYRVIRKDFSCGPCQYTPQYRVKEKENCLNGNVTSCMKAIDTIEVTSAIKSIL